MRRAPMVNESTVIEEPTVSVPEAEVLMESIDETGIMREFVEEEADVVRAIAARTLTGAELVGALLEPTRRLMNRDGEPCSTTVLRSVMLSIIAVVAWDTPGVIRAAIDDMKSIRPHSRG